MPIAEYATVSFRAMGTEHTVTVRDHAQMETAAAAAREIIIAVDNACSRFLPASELTAINRAAGRGPQPVSELLYAAVSGAIDAAKATDGMVDPTVGQSLVTLGYSVTFAEISGNLGPVTSVHIPQGWRCVVLDPVARTVALPAGVVLDLGATGKAWAADLAARAASEAAKCGVIVSSGGDVAVAGDACGGWDVGISGGDAVPAPAQTISVVSGGVATSAPAVRMWQRAGKTVHHIIDPRTGLSVSTPWAMVSVAASTCAGANAAATAAVIFGPRAAAWLEERNLPARLIAQDGSVSTTAGWPS